MYIDIMTAKLIAPKHRTQFGKRYAMFEAIHGSAPRMVDEGRAQYADRASMIRAAGMLIRHIGCEDKASKLEMALDICGQFEKKIV